MLKNDIPESLKSLLVPINSVKPDPRNARKHPARNLAAIKLSLETYGQRKPIVVNSRTGHIEAGNGLWQAAKALGWKEIAAVKVDDDGKTAAAYGIMDNRSAELADWDLPVLKDILQELDTGELEMDITGFDADSLEGIMTQVHIESELPGDWAEYFLLRPKWNEVKGLKFLSILSYNRKRHDDAVAWFKTKKRECSGAFIEELVSLFHRHLTATFGNLETLTLTNAPRGHSKTAKHLPGEIARALAGKMGCQFQPVFKGRELIGGSHPRTWDERGEIELAADIPERVLLIDDVASTGTTITACLRALKGCFVIPVVLIYEDAG